MLKRLRSLFHQLGRQSIFVNQLSLVSNQLKQTETPTNLLRKFSIE